LEERENSNRILKNILAKLDSINQLTPSSVSVTPHSIEAEHFLPEVDEKILAFVKKSGKTTAEEVRVQFNYKGKNAACARLNRLYEMNLVEKKQVGKKVYFIPMSR
jgi:predicted HTH transcriptional regulator